MRGVVAALPAALLSAFIGCGGSSSRHSERNAGVGGTVAGSGRAGSSGAGGAGFHAGGGGLGGTGLGGGLNTGGASAGARDSVDCSGGRHCAVDFPCLGGDICLTIQGCSGGSVCGDPTTLCAEACGDAGCVTVPATGSSAAILRCADGSRPRTGEPIEGFAESCSALPDELERLERCTSNSDCGQILDTFPLCSSLPGPGRPPVVRNDADLTELNRLLTMFPADGCPAVRRACSCTTDDPSVACIDAHCGWIAAGSCGTAGSGGTGGDLGSGGTGGTAGSAGATDVGEGGAAAAEYPGALVTGVWLVGWSGDLDHYSWVRFRSSSPDATTGTWDALDASCSTCSAYLACEGGPGTWSGFPYAGGLYQVTLTPWASCADTSMHSWSFLEAVAATYPPGAERGALLAVDAQSMVTALRYADSACDADFFELLVVSSW